MPNEELLSFLKKDLGRHYFMLLGMENVEKTFEWIQVFKSDDLGIKGVLFMRRSGNLQLAVDPQLDTHDPLWDQLWKKIIETPFEELITLKSIGERFKAYSQTLSWDEGGSIACLQVDQKMTPLDCKDEKATSILIEDLDQVVTLYKKVFKSFASLKVMEKKIRESRGRGYGIWHDHQLISVAQSDFETKTDAVIVGVATDPSKQRQGYGGSVLNQLVFELQQEGKNQYLIFDDPRAGKIYMKMGFQIYDQIIKIRGL